MQWMIRDAEVARLERRPLWAIRWLFPMVVLVGACPAGSFAAGQRQQRLVPANFSQKTDSQGFRWDVMNYGQIGSGTNSCFDGAATLTVNNSSFRPTQRMMTPDGSEYVLTANVSNLVVTRRIKVDAQACAVRYVETLQNRSSAPITANLMLRTRLPRGPAQALVTDAGVAAGMTLGKKDTGVVLLGRPNSGQISLAFHLAGARSKLKPTIQNQNNYEFIFSYAVTVKPGKTASILHGIAQRRLVSIPDAKAGAAVFKPFNSRSWTRDLPREIRRSIVNLGGYSFGGLGDAESLVTLEALDVERQAADVLAVGEQTRLHGTASFKSLSVETHFGPLSLDFEKVAALAGPRCTGGKPRVFLVDGQVYNGPITVEDLQFTMNSGVQLKLEPEHLDRLVRRATPDDGKPAEGVVAMLETTNGDRLALLQAKDQQIAVATPWGNRQIPLGDVEQMFLGEQKVGHHLVLRGGTRLFAFASGSALSLKTLFFGEQEFTPPQIHRMTAAHLSASGQDDITDIGAPHLLLVGENVLVGQVDLPAIHFITSGQMIPVPPNQIRLLRNVTGETGDASESGPVFEGELWDGGTVSGTLSELVLPVRSADQVAQVPLCDILEIHVPMPVVADTMRGKIAQLIRDLGHPEYARRKAAHEALAELGHLPRLQLDEALRQTSDPEVRRSIENLLAELQK